MACRFQGRRKVPPPLRNGPGKELGSSADWPAHHHRRPLSHRDPHGNYTREIDDKIESPSVNLETLDCWTFYESSLAFARMIKSSPSLWSRESLLRYIELERYRDGRCDGSYLSRMHPLEEVFANNANRGLGGNVTASLGGVFVHRNVCEMQSA